MRLRKGKRKCHWCRSGSRTLIRCLSCRKEFYCLCCIKEQYVVFSMLICLNWLVFFVGCLMAYPFGACVIKVVIFV